MQITVQSEILHIQVYLNGILHVHLVREKFLGLNTWVWEHENRYCIEYVSVGNKMLCEYDSSEKFQAILTELSKVL